MKTYVALLRGINVTGHNKIKMIELKSLFINLGFKNVTTYIQSGNVIFEANKSDTKKIEEQIISAVKNQFNYTINVLVITIDYLKTIFNSNPFLKRENIDITKLHVTLLKNEPNLESISQIRNLIKTNDDEFEILNKCVYLYCQNGYGKTKLNNNLFEKKLKSPATTRNWKTISKLVELSSLNIE
jgi:uncharacterized protein (DUF1697 family)